MGDDFGVPVGTPVDAAADGYVESAGPHGGFGNAVVVRHAGGYTTLYGHLSNIHVKPGQPVVAGSRLGESGATGTVTGPNLHFGTYRNGQPVAPRFAPAAQVDLPDQSAIDQAFGVGGGQPGAAAPVAGPAADPPDEAPAGPATPPDLPPQSDLDAAFGVSRVGAPDSAGGPPGSGRVTYTQPGGTPKPAPAALEATVLQRTQQGLYDPNGAPGSDTTPYFELPGASPVPPGAAKIDINGIFHPATPAGAATAQAQAQGAAETQTNGALGPAAGFMATVNRAIPFADEMEAGIGAGLDTVEGKAPNLGAAWKMERDRQTGMVDQFQADHPLISDLATGTGYAVQALPALATGGASLAADAPAAARAATVGGRVVQNAVRVGRAAPGLATTGAAYSAANAFADRGSLEARTHAANDAVLPGAVAGVAIPAGVNAMGKLAGATRRAVRPGFNAIRDVVAPFGAAVSKGAAEKVVGRQLEHAGTDPAALRTALANGAEEIVPGSVPTTFQQTGDLGIGAAEKAASTKSAEPFKQRQADQNSARLTSLGSIQAGADPAAVGRFFSNRLSDIDASTQAAVEAAQAAAQARGGTLGGNGTPEGYGVDLRAAIQAAEDAGKARLSALYDAAKVADQTGNVTATINPARQIMSDVSPSAKPMQGEELAIFQTAANYPPLTPLRDLLALRSRVSAEMRVQRGPAGDPQALRRLTMLRGAIEDNLGSSIADAVTSEQAAVANGAMRPEDTVVGGLQRYQDRWIGNQETGRGSAVADVGRAQNPGRSAAGVPSLDGTGGSAPGRFGGPAGVAGLPEADVARARSDVASTAGPKGSLWRQMQELGGMRTRGPDGAPLGGVDVGGALTDAKPPPGVLNQNGLTPEQMAQALADRGFFGPNVGDPTKAFEEALTNQAQGRRVFAPGVNDSIDQAGRSQVSGEMDAAGVSASDRTDVASQKLATYRAALTDLRARADRLGIDHADAMSPEDLWGEVQEREAIQAESGGAPAGPDYGAEFDRLVAKGRQQTPTVDQATLDQLDTATAAARAHHDVFGIQPVSGILSEDGVRGRYTMRDGSVPGSVWNGRPDEFDRVQAALRAGGPEALGVLQDHAAASLRAAAMVDGVIDPARFARWRTAHAGGLRALPEATQARFADAASAGQAVADAAVARTQALSGAKLGAAAKMLNLSDPEAVTATVGALFGKPTAIAEMRALAHAVTGNPEARAGLRQAVADYISTKLVSNTEAATSGENLIKGDQFQTFMGENRSALAQVFSAAEMRTLDAIAEDIHRSSRSANALRTSGSDTAQNQSLVARLFGVVSRNSLGLAGGAAGLAAGHGLEGAGAGALVGLLLKEWRSVGVERINDLLTRALLDPEVARALLARIPAGAADTSPAVLAARRRLTSALAASGGLGVAAARDQRPDPPPTPNAITFKASPASASANVNAMTGR